MYGGPTGAVQRGAWHLLRPTNSSLRTLQLFHARLLCVRQSCCTAGPRACTIIPDFCPPSLAGRLSSQGFSSGDRSNTWQKPQLHTRASSSSRCSTPRSQQKTAASSEQELLVRPRHTEPSCCRSVGTFHRMAGAVSARAALTVCQAKQPAGRTPNRSRPSATRRQIAETIDSIQQVERSGRSAFLSDFLIEQMASNALPMPQGTGVPLCKAPV